ncbi:unnamed protein product [Symbiodinium necroappetens]|uniref:Uncharacterized protein n=1 Tax=Symbiodinium necroappetens TaxID=1628268 RepID=A0A812SBN6_9DINO|nr:unnamed protein product [Symbiodinium necroappetens]
MLQGFAGQASRSKPVIWLRLRNRASPAFLHPPSMAATTSMARRRLTGHSPQEGLSFGMVADMSLARLAELSTQGAETPESAAAHYGVEHCHESIAQEPVNLTRALASMEHSTEGMRESAGAGVRKIESRLLTCIARPDRTPVITHLFLAVKASSLPWQRRLQEGRR